MSEIFTETERREIAGRARPLHQRLSGPENEGGSDPPVDPERTVTAWKNAFATEEQFQSRLEREGVSEQRVREQIAATRWPAAEPLPEWIAELEALLRFVLASSEPDGETGTETRHAAEETSSDDGENPFPELLDPVVTYGVAQLPELAVSKTALAPLVSSLRSELGSLATRVLYVEFKSFIEAHDPALAAADSDEFDEPPTEYYEQFIDAMLEHGTKNLCLEYPVLARELCRSVDQWVTAVTELCYRIEADRDALGEQFDIEGDVQEIEPLSEDAHDGSRVPVEVVFERGSVIYKPRPVDGGTTFYEIVDRLDEHLSTPSITTPTYLSRDGYGWMETVEYRDLSASTDATQYYERAGVLLALSYVLNFTDSQLENVIVQGENPVIVDGETLFHPSVDSAEKPARTEITTAVDDSVLCTALVPWSIGDPRVRANEGIAASTAGLGSKSGQVAFPNRPRPVIEAVNTDVMSVSDEPLKVGLTTNIPSIGEEDYPPEDHVESIRRGFTEAYETIQDLHETGRFLSDIVTRELVSDIENRFIFRSTMEYASVLNSTLGRTPFQDGARLTVEYESLAATHFGGETATDRYWELYEAERRALARREVPRFTSQPTRRELFQKGQTVDVTVEKSGYEQFRERLDSLCEADRKRQQWMLASAFGGTIQVDELPPETPAPTDSLEAEATALFDLSNDALVQTEDGENWLTVSPSSGGVNLFPADNTLYWGRCGIALTAAALAAVTGESRYYRRAEETLEPVLTAVRDGTLSATLGGVRGIGSVIYGLSVAAELLEDERYADAALQATQLVSESLLEDDETFDVMEGTAGTLLALLAYHERFGGSAVLDRARACGDHLLAARSDIAGYQTWRTKEDGAALTGFAHGSSGIAYALARLAAATGESRYEEATREALEFESSLYDAAEANWARSNRAAVAVEQQENTQSETRTVHDSSGNSPRQFAYADRWCHGRTGMGLARVAIAEQLDDRALLEEATTALSATATAEPSHLDNVCCGNAGRIEALLVGSQRAGIDQREAAELAGRCLARRRDGGTLSLQGHGESGVNPTFFDGVAGFAYTLLRLRDPESLPCVLLLE